MQELYHQLLTDLQTLGISVPFHLELKTYSKCFYGRYNPNNNKVTVYVYRDPHKTKMFSYKELLLTAVHEVIHAMQWNSPTYSRKQGIMHDLEFHALYREYSNRVKALLYFREVKESC